MGFEDSRGTDRKGRQYPSFRTTTTEGSAPPGPPSQPPVRGGRDMTPTSKNPVWISAKGTHPCHHETAYHHRHSWEKLTASQTMRNLSEGSPKERNTPKYQGTRSSQLWRKRKTSPCQMLESLPAWPWTRRMK